MTTTNAPSTTSQVTSSQVTIAKPPTIHDVAAALGLHKSTVSLAFSGKGNLASATRQRILETARELGYEPNPVAQQLAYGGSNNTVAIFSGLLDVGLATEKILFIQRELNRRSLEVPIYTSGENNEAQVAQIKQLCRQRPRAIVCAAHRFDALMIEELETYRRKGGIVVSYDVPISLDCDQVIFDREDNAYEAARHLLEQGHRHIGLGMSTLTGGSLSAVQSQRLQGFRRALEEFNAPWRDEWFFQNPTYETGGTAMVQRFFELDERPTGLCIVNDYVALGFMVELMRAGLRVPDDISIIGHDNQPVAAYCPVPLTCMSQPVEEIGCNVVEMLLERIEGRTKPSRVVTVKGHLVTRESVAVPPVL